MKQQSEELRKAEKQERLLMLRDRDNAVAAEDVLREILNVVQGWDALLHQIETMHREKL